jgi:hypothetical protein
MAIIEATARTWAGTIAGLPVRIAIVAAWDVLIIALARFLGLADGVRTALDRQVIRRLRLRCWPRLFSPLWATLPLPTTVLLLLGAIKMLVLWTGLIVFWPRLVVFRPWLIVLRARLVILRARLFITLPSALRPSFMLAAAFGTRVFCHYLRADGHHQQTYTCHTPDALHAIPHCG